VPEGCGTGGGGQQLSSRELLRLKAGHRTLWRAFQFCFKVYTFAGGHERRGREGVHGRGVGDGAVPSLLLGLGQTVHCSLCSKNRDRTVHPFLLRLGQTLRLLQQCDVL